MMYLEERGETMKKNFENDFLNALRTGRVNVIPVSMDEDKTINEIDFHNVISKMAKENKVPREIVDGLSKLFNFEEPKKQEKKADTKLDKEGTLQKDIILSESVVIPKGAKYKVVEEIDKTTVKVLFSEYLVNILGRISTNSNLEIDMPIAFYKENIETRVVYLKELNSLTDYEIDSKTVELDGNKITYISKENLVKSLMKEYNLYKPEKKVTVEDIVKNNLTVDYGLIDRAMLSLGYIRVGGNGDIYIK